MIDGRMTRRSASYRGDSCRSNTCRSNTCRSDLIGSEELMKKLRTVDFAIIETALYLDSYPKCRKALEYYRELVKEREMLAEAVNRKYGPMTIRDNESCDAWTWTEGPWPWEADAN